MATLPIQFTASVSGTTLTLVMTSDPNYGATVNNYDATLAYAPSTATYVRSTGASGFLYAANPTTGKVVVSAASTDGTAPGTTLATFIFTLTSNVSDFPLTLTNVALNDDQPVSGSADPTVPCFVKGTLISTRDGETAVEDLREGDLVRTEEGALLAVRWIGRRQVACGAHPLPHDVMPVRVQSGAVAEGLPARDLLLSPDHALLLDGAFIPVRYLLNGATIVQERWSVVTYFHIELERHAALLAEGLPAESYLDSGNRALFEGEATTVVVLPGHALSVWSEKAFAPLVFEGEHLTQVRARLLDRAETMGHATTADPGLHVIAGDKVLQPRREGNCYAFTLPAGLASVRLRSRSFVPSHLLPTSIDARQLGVAVERLEIDGAERRAGSDDGWYDAESGLRWTDGDAEIVTPGRRLTVTLAPLGVYRDVPAGAAPVRKAARVA